MPQKCLACKRIQKIKDNTNPYFVAELETGYVVIGDFQYFKGYTLFLCKEHKTELHQLDDATRKNYLNEMSWVAEAVNVAFQPKKINYELLGNTFPHMHWHIFPRYGNDPDPSMPIWRVDKSVRCTPEYKVEGKELLHLKQKLLEALKTTCKSIERNYEN